MTRPCCRLAVAVGLLLGSSLPGWADETSSSRLDQITAKLSQPKVELRYKLQPNETVRTKVIHRVTVETKIQGVTQVAKTSSVSTKVWKVVAVDDDGNMTFVHSVDDVDMWQGVTGRQEVTYNSKTDATPPPLYEKVAQSLGRPLATVVIAPNGKVVRRENTQPQFNPGIGELTVPLPDGAVAVGHQWSAPEELRVRTEDGRTKRIQTRQLYTLQSVKSGVASIDVKTEVLTPLNDARIESQIVQRLKTGNIRFDVLNGRVLAKQMDMDRTVIGFNGADSSMQYLARFSEQLLTDVADDAAAKAARTSSPAKTRKQ